MTHQHPSSHFIPKQYHQQLIT